MRTSRPKAMTSFYKDSFTYSNLKTDMTGKRVLNITVKIFVRKCPMFAKVFSSCGLADLKL